jgi:signal transduction histidine kinase
VIWFGSAAVVLSALLSRRRQRILDLAAARGRLVAQAVDAEERARKRLSDDLHDHAIQNVLTARPWPLLRAHRARSHRRRCPRPAACLARARALGNISKHAAATEATVSLTRRGRDFVLEVSDNGRGFTKHEQLSALLRGHIGLASTRERVEAYAGTFEILSEPGAGTRVRCFYPSHPFTRPIDRKCHDRLTKDR